MSLVLNLSTFLKKSLSFQHIYTLLFSILLFSIPFAFSPETRSVFEIHKLTILRVTTILICITYIYESLFTTNLHNCSINFFGMRWHTTQLEKPILLVVLSLLISTFFSESLHISLVGTYDRWEGLWTSLNYIILFFISMVTIRKNKYKFNLLLVIITSTSLATFYGIFQSLGLDPTNWSMEPESRVFATINNPVHYCAYMAMSLPLLIGFSSYIKDSGKKNWKKILLYLACGLCFYAMILSYTRASWLGFSSSSALLYLFAQLNLKEIKGNYIYKLYASTLLLCASLYLLFVFNIIEKSLVSLITFTSILLVALFLIINFEKKLIKNVNFKYTQLIPVIGIILYYILQLFTPHFVWIPYLQILILTLCLFSLKKVNCNFKFFVLSNSSIMLFIHFLSSGINLISLLSTGLFFFIFYTALNLDNPNSQITGVSSHKQQPFINYFILFLVIFLLSTLGVQTTQLILNNNNPTLKNINYRVNSLSNVAVKGTVRTSTWKSAYPWIKDYFWIGSGLDTVKYKFSTYRRLDYNQLAGVHNATPDRLHNDYLDKFVTRGILGVVVYYGFFFGTWLFLLLRYCRDFSMHTILIQACLSSVMSFQVQVLFNFGVVPTFTLLFIVMGLAISFIQSKDHTAMETD